MRDLFCRNAIHACSVPTVPKLTQMCQGDCVRGVLVRTRFEVGWWGGLPGTCHARISKYEYRDRYGPPALHAGRQTIPNGDLDSFDGGRSSAAMVLCARYNRAVSGF